MKKTIEVEVGEKVTEAVDKSKVGKTHPGPQPKGEVSGHAIVRKWIICPHCVEPSWIWYDTCGYHFYDCCHCGGTFRA